MRQLLRTQSHEEYVANARKLKLGGIVVVELLKYQQTTLSLSNNTESANVVITKIEIATVELTTKETQPHFLIAALPKPLGIAQVRLSLGIALARFEPMLWSGEKQRSCDLAQ